jgi:hypothetical protein
MAKEGVDTEVIALQMTKGSSHNQTFTERDIEAYVKLAKESKLGVKLTAAQTRALRRDVRSKIVVYNMCQYVPDDA